MTSKDSDGVKQKEKSSEMNPAVKNLFTAVENGSVEEICKLLSSGVNVDSVDENGMTPLMMAAYKSNKDLCYLFIKHGANVNSSAHQHGYTALMFAALTGSKEVIRLLLENGARTNVENSVHRTASQMAAFVGQPEAASLINNFFDREDLEYYCEPHGFDKEPKLPRELAGPLYKYILIVNLNPVRLVMYLQQTVELLDNGDKIQRVLDLLVERVMKQRETNEVLALKFHYLRYVLVEAEKSLKEKKDNLEYFIKYLLNSKQSVGVPENQERLIRQMLKQFPYPNSALFHQIVTTLASPKMSPNPLASSVLTSSINGQRMASADDKMCTTCGEFHGLTCSTCKSVNYCNKECQKLHWFVHKKFCKILAEEEAKRQIEEEKRKSAAELSQGQSQELGQGKELGQGDEKLDEKGQIDESCCETPENTDKDVNSSQTSDRTVEELSENLSIA